MYMACSVVLRMTANTHDESLDRDQATVIQRIIRYLIQASRHEAVACKRHSLIVVVTILTFQAQATIRFIHKGCAVAARLQLHL
jgi:hypothetical protein